MKAHFIGICGVGMSAVAKLLMDKGYSITGSDEGFYEPVSSYLKKIGIEYVPNYNKENVPRDADFIVIGKHAKLIPEENEEVKAAEDSGKTLKSFPEILQELTDKTRNIVVAGSYGKSTCTALISWILENSGKNPSFFIGAIPETPNVSSKLGSSKTFVLEGDEYPASNWDRRAKFLHFKIGDVLMTSLSHDHINIYPTHKDYIEPFNELVKKIPNDGLLTISQNTKKYLGEVNKKFVTYSTEPDGSDWWTGNISWGEITSFDLVNKGNVLERLETNLLGLHNIENIVGSAAILLEKKLVNIEELKSGVRTFKALKRRLDLKSEKTSVKIYEGFGSSYHKAKSAIEAIRKHYPEKRLVIIFEPHTFSWRNRDSLHWYDDIFKDGDKIFIYKPPSHGSGTHDQLSLNEIVERVKKYKDVEGFDNPNEGFEKIKREIKKDDLILIQTSGDLDGLIKRIPKYLEEVFPL